MPDLPPHECWSLATRRLGRRVLVFPSLDSTNSLALSLDPDPANHGLALLADQQTAGRGQYGRSWQVPAKSSVLMSLLLFPPPALCRAALLTTWAAVAVADLIQELTGRQARIKWPNDVYLHGKKVCGILIEQRSTAAGQAPATAVGIGLNVNQPTESFEAAGLPLGGSLFSVTGANLRREDVARRLIHHLDDTYEALHQGSFGAVESRWRERLELLGRRVRVETLDGHHEGRLLDVTLEAIVFEVDGSAPLRILPERVRHLVEG